MNIKATFRGNDAEASAQFGEVQYGLAATVEVGDVTDGESAAVYNVGTAQNARLNFVLPRGKQGDPGPDGAPGKDGEPGRDGADGAPGRAATIEIGNVSVGEVPAVENSGTENAAVLDFTLPEGVPGAPGKDGQQLWAAYVDENGHLIVQYEGAEAPPLRLDENGHLLYDANGQTVDLGLVKGQDGAPGQSGSKGDTGEQGAPGKAATIQVGAVTEGDEPAVSNSGTSEDAILNFVLPRGPQGIPGQPGKDGAGVPSSEGVPGNYVLTPNGWVASAGGMSFLNIKTRLIADLTIDQSDIPINIYITQDIDGKPINCRAIIIQSDYQSSVSYALFDLNYNGSGATEPNLRINAYSTWKKGSALFIGLTKDNGYILSGDSTGKFSSYPHDGNGSDGNIFKNPNAIQTIKVGYIKSLTFLKVWEVLE